MKAIVISEPGGPEVLKLEDVPDPEVPHGHVRIKVRAVGVNRADLVQRAGFYAAPPGVPADIPGLEYCGEIETLGPGVTRFTKGDWVYGIVGGGAYAELIVVHEREVTFSPAHLEAPEAAACPEAFITAYDALVVRGGLRPGEKVLVHAAGSGVGTAGIQIARALGCFTIGTARTPDKLKRCLDLGLSVGVVPEKGAFADEVKKASGGGVDVVLDLVGGAYVAENLGCMAKLGRAVIVGLTGGPRADISVGELLMKRLTIVGTVLRARPLEEKIAAAQLLEKTISPWLAEGRVKPIVDRTFPLAEAAAAHAYVASNESFGKVVLTVV